MNTTNPLTSFFRQPAIYLRLPSQGKFWPENSLNMPANGELPVFPMTAMDEITYRTPDALFNGSALISVIQSCIPDIKNAWYIPSCDLDTILISIRIASYGHSMDFDSTCPKCSHENTFGLDLRSILDSFKLPEYSDPLVLGDLLINFKPADYRAMNEINLKAFENQKIIQSASHEGLSEEARVKIISDSYKEIAENTFSAITQSVASIRTPDTLVTDSNFIKEFLTNCDRQIYEQIKNRSIALKESVEIKPLTVKCTNCNNEYQQPFTLDMTNFFAVAS